MAFWTWKPFRVRAGSWVILLEEWEEENGTSYPQSKLHWTGGLSKTVAFQGVEDAEKAIEELKRNWKFRTVHPLYEDAISDHMLFSEV